ncbi:MAG: YdcF family protein [Ruminococcus sp.]|nr:YdcF family protein [Ruminococcus sp.]
MNRRICIISGIATLLFCFFYIAVTGNTYTTDVTLPEYFESSKGITVDVEDESVAVVSDVQIHGNKLEMNIQSLKKGQTIIRVTDILHNQIIYTAYVHTFGVITFDRFFGSCSGDIIIPIASSVYLAFLLFLLIREHIKSVKQNLYQHKNILTLGLIIFLFFMLINQLTQLINHGGAMQTINSIVNSASLFAVVILPFAFIVSIFVTISNINLMRKEGFSWRNMLGIIMGIVFCFATVIPFILGEWLQRTTIVDVHNENGMALYVELFVENGILAVVAYLECVLLGTIITSVKAARRIPRFNRDYIIILGCQIRQDGKLTKLLQSRADRAIEFAKMQSEADDRELYFIASGGQGDDEVTSEAEAIKNYLLSCGVSPDKILVEDQSTNTYENFKNSMELIRSHAEKEHIRIAYSTTNYHVFRVGLLASEQGIRVEGIGSRTKQYYWINAFIREYIATLYHERKSHRRIVGALVLIDLFMVLLDYLSRNI